MFTQKDLLKTMETVSYDQKALDGLFETIQGMFEFGLINYTQYSKIERYYEKLSVANGSYIVLGIH